MSANQPTVEILKAFLNAFNRHDLDAIMNFFCEDCIFDMPRGPEPRGRRYTGKKEVRDRLAIRFSSLPDVHYGCDLLEFKGDKIFHKNSFWKLVENSRQFVASVKI